MLVLVRVNNVKIVAMAVVLNLVSHHHFDVVRGCAVRSTVSTPIFNSAVGLAGCVVYMATYARTTKTLYLLPIFGRRCN